MSNDRTLPRLLRLIMTGMALTQIAFGLTLFLNPAAIANLWPWALSEATARLLAASTLVTVPLAMLSVMANRASVARIPMVMMIAYRLVQLSAGVVHIARFDLSRPTTWNYFGGGLFMLVVMALWLARADRLGQPVAGAPSWIGGEAPLKMGGMARWVFRLAGIVYVLLAVIFFAQGKDADWLWFEPAKLTPLTARLFASPTLGLGLALWLVTRARLWRQVAVPAAGMVTFGLVGGLAFATSWHNVAPTTIAGYAIPLTPLVLFVLGLYLLVSARDRV